jgi:hypothetical protein
VSGLLHVALGTAIVLASAASDARSGPTASPGAGARTGSRQLRGDQRKRPVGRDLLFDILSAGDGVAVRLTSPTGDPAVGLAWWSPSRGMWLAVDLAASHAGRALQVWQRVGDGSRAQVASVELDASGSGRVITAWDEDHDIAPTHAVTLTLTDTRGHWPFVERPLVLTGTAEGR